MKAKLSFGVIARVVKCFLLKALLIVMGVSLAKEVDLDMHFDTGHFGSSTNHVYKVKTDSEELLKFETKFSNIADDVFCKHARRWGVINVKRGTPDESTFNFSQKGSPNVALYEWHLCFEYRGVTYRGWRGFDPGVESKLSVECTINVEQLKARRTELYFCQTAKVGHDQHLYSEYAQYCWSEDKCKRFETERDYQLFLSRGLKDIALNRIDPDSVIRSAVINHDFMDEQAANQHIKDAEADARDRCKEDKVDAVECESNLNYLRDYWASSDEWRFQLTESSVREVFPEIDGQELVLNKVNYSAFSPYRTFTFAPHQVSKDTIRYHVVTCDLQDEQDSTVSDCRLSDKGRFYSISPEESFGIADMTNVDLALWAHRVHKGIKVEPQNPRLKPLADGDSLLLSIAIDGQVAEFRYGRGGCWHSVFYTIVGDRETLVFDDIRNAVCV